MTIPTTGDPTQFGDGNTSNKNTGVQAAPQTATTSATLTAAQMLGGILVGTAGTSAVTYTLPTVTVFEAGLPNTQIDQTFDLTIINLGTSSGVVTVAVGTGFTLVGMATLPITTSAGSSATFRFRKTGVGAWTLYRIS